MGWAAVCCWFPRKKSRGVAGKSIKSGKQKQSGKSSRKPGTSSKSSRSGPRAVGAAGVKKSSRSKRDSGSSKSGRVSKSGRSSKSAKPTDAPEKTGVAPPPKPPRGVWRAVVRRLTTIREDGEPSSKSSSSKRRSEKDKLKPKDKSVEGSKRSSRSKRSSKSRRSSRRSSRSKKSAPKKENALQVDKTREMSGVAPPSKKDLPLKTAVSPVAVSVTKLHPVPVEAVAKQEIRIEPSELRWKSTGGIQNVVVYNHSNTRKAFKIKCSDNLLYRVNPVHEFIPAGGSLRVDVLWLGGTAKVDKIVIIAADAGVSDPNAREVLTRSTNTDMTVLPLIATAAN